MIRKILFIAIVLLFSIGKINAVKWETISFGFWNNAAIWKSGIVPPAGGNDTFYIKHPVVFATNLAFNNGAFIKIDSTGGLCGHQKINLNPGSKLISYGILESDTLHVSGGQASLFTASQTTLTCYGIISNGGSFFCSGSLIVGPWFNCRSPEFSFAGINELSLQVEVRLYPNPAQSIIKLDYPHEFNKSTVTITNLNGKIILESQLTQFIDISQLQPGVYFLTISNENGKQKHFKILKE